MSDDDLFSSWSESGWEGPLLSQLYKLRSTVTNEIFWACPSGGTVDGAHLLLPGGEEKLVKRDYRQEAGRRYAMYTFDNGLYEFVR